ncbi:chemotaxis protein CheB [Actinoplanes sp. CA-030573]|uniref:chemotaxis protein CheB n=1 Tax=Actinoplanes sp. CA-030573 TaxID=3239898 RepID=UPI003D94C73A
MAHRDVVVVGASAGGVEALRAMAAGLPADLPASVLIVLHMPAAAPSALPQILTRSGPLIARTAFDGEPLIEGRIYVAPPDQHLLVLDHRVRLSRGPSENGHRPAIDPLFRSAARAAGARVIAVTLSGSRDDGAVGSEEVAAHGGVVAVQDPADALNPSMPRAVLARVGAAHVATAADLGKLIGEQTATEVADQPAPVDVRLGAEVAIDDFAPITTDRLTETPPVFGCPSCGGGLYELESWPLPRYRCRVGHAWSPESLLDEQALATEGALWTALRALEEKAALSRRMATRSPGDAIRFGALAEDAEGAARLIRDLLARLGGSTAAREK